jgi:hypothetical protein
MEPQLLPIVQPLQSGPPQSTSVSDPFWMPSEHVGAWHVPPSQTPLWQSPSPLQSSPATQAEQLEPPQSTSVSSRFWVLSEQVGTWQTLEAQMALWQSPSSPQV